MGALLSQDKEIAKMECSQQSPKISRSATQEALSGRVPEGTLETLLRNLVEGDFSARWQVAKVLKSYGEAAHERLIAIAETSFQDPDLQGFIVGILGANPTPATLLTLVKILKRSPDEELKETIVLTLGKQGPSQVDALLELAAQPELQSPVLRALVQIHHPCTINGLLRFARHDNSDFRALALEALGQFHGEQITGLLKQGIEDTSSSVRSVCVKALGLRQSNEVDEPLISAVSARLYDTHPKVCDQAARALGRFNHSLALENLWQRLIAQKTLTPLSQSLIQALGWSSHPTGIQFLLKLLTQISSDTPELKLSLPWPPQLVNDLIQTLTHVESAAMTHVISQQFIALLSSQVQPFQHIQVRQRLIMAIAQLGQDQSIPALIHALAIQDERIRFHLVAALKQINSGLSQEKLVAYRQESDLDPTLKTGIAFALKEW